MPQVFHVLRCYSCKTFQVHQVKKATRWSCKLCGEKQSVKNVYGEGTGADCRHHVQKLNMLRAAEDEATVLPKYETACCDSRPAAEDITQSQRESSDVSVSKWMQYMTQVKDTEGTDDNTSDDIKFTLDRRTFEESKERKRGRPDRLVRGRKRKCNSAVAHPGNPQHHAINISSRSCSYNGEFKPNSQLDTNRNISREPRVDRVTNISTDMPIQVTGGLLRDNKSSHAQVASSRTTFLPESTNTTHASRNVLLSRHPNVHQITKGIVSALSGDCKQGIENRRNSEKELSRGEVLSSGSKWAQFVTPEDDADSSDSSANESDWSMLKDNNKNVPNISGACNQQRFKGESSQNVPVIFSGNISENRLKTQHCPNFSLAGDGEDDEDLDSVIADWPIA